MARDDIHGPQPFRTWWNRPILEDLRNETFTRKELVLFLAHKFGGAHVDPNMEPRFVAITRFNSLGWGWKREGDTTSLEVPAGPDCEPMGTPIPVNVRQIAYELETSLRDQLGE